ncbi:MAG: sporulation protein YqfC [Bacillota bacterium]
MTWKDLSKRLKRQMSEFLELPGEIILDLPKVVLVGGLQLIVENHRGILKFSSDAIHINISEGELIIKGKDLRLRSVLPEEIWVEGQIKSIAYGGDE